jgi:hypothetical protein
VQIFVATVDDVDSLGLIKRLECFVAPSEQCLSADRGETGLACDKAGGDEQVRAFFVRFRDQQRGDSRECRLREQFESQCRPQCLLIERPEVVVHGTVDEQLGLDPERFVVIGRRHRVASFM